MKTKMIIGAMLLVVTFTANAQTKRVKFGEGLKKKVVSFVAKVQRVGSTRLALMLKNHGKDSMLVDLENGRIFESKEHYQPFVITRSKLLALAPNETKEFHLPGYCGNSSAPGAPIDFEGFVNTRMAPDEMVRVLTQLEAQRLDNYGQMQNLVWMFTNHHAFSTIYAENEEGRNFANAVAAAMKVARPSYSVLYKAPSEESQFMFTGVAEKISAEVTFTAKETTSVDFLILDSEGKVVRYLRHDESVAPGEYATALQANLAGVQQGQYYLVVKDEKGRSLHQTALEI